MAEVTLQGIRKTYPNGYVAVESLELQIRDREFMVLVGPSGCGKSTTLRMIAGLESISSGTLSIDGRRVNEVPPKDRDIAMVFQAYALYPHMTVAENMGFPLKMRKVAAAEIERKVKEAAEILDIAHLLARHPKALSGGQKQRVALGRAIVRQPKVFLLDEPLSNLDAKLRVQMRAELGKLHRRLQVTMIYVTHDQVEAMTLGDRITVMNGGAIQQVDTPKTVYERPANRFVAGFIGSPPMNFLDVQLTRRDDGWLASGEGFELRLDGPLAAAAAAHDGGAAVLGVRPEDLSVRSGDLTVRGGGEGEGGRTLRALVEVLEPVGGEAYVHLRLGAAPLVARVARYEGIAEGEPLELVLDLERARLFGAEGGEAWTA